MVNNFYLARKNNWILEGKKFPSYFAKSLKTVDGNKKFLILKVYLAKYDFNIKGDFNIFKWIEFIKKNKNKKNIKLKILNGKGNILYKIIYKKLKIEKIIKNVNLNNNKEIILKIRISYNNCEVIK